MISRTECYVYLVLPGDTRFTTAGKLVLAIGAHGEAIGHFVYGRSYLTRTDAVELDPFELRLGEGTYITASHEGLFGTLRDASPDYWGRLVIERHMQSAGLSELDYLLNSPDDRAGALGFGIGQEPPAPMRRFNRTLDLEVLQQTADELLSDAPLQRVSMERQTRELIEPGTSLGGARPKVTIEYEGALWLAKFNTLTDRWDNALVEHGMLRLAAVCGISVPPSKVVVVGNRHVLLVKRFDRSIAEEGYFRHRMISALTALRADESPTHRVRWSYILLAEELRRFSATAKKDAEELFKRMVFNALISNSDDHPRNHAFVAQRDWRLSPAYDLTVTPQMSRDRRSLAMTCGKWGTVANRANLLSHCQRFLLSEEDASAIIDRMYDIVKSRWYGTLKGVGLTEHDCGLVESAFVYPGFLYPPDVE
jgi:serine/threonine-protein kinase HipA